jgi:hypothetical protein
MLAVKHKRNKVNLRNKPDSLIFKKTYQHLLSLKKNRKKNFL